jgi:hypothetical protein
MRFDACTSVIDGDLHAINFTCVRQLLLMLYWTCCDFLFVSTSLCFPLFTYTTGPVRQQPNKFKICDSTEITKNDASTRVEMRMK